MRAIRLIPSVFLVLCFAALPAQGGLQKDPACLDDCQIQFDDCTSYSGCNYSDCSDCRVRYDSCVQFCPYVCTDPKSVTNTNKFQAVSGAIAGPNQCLEYSWENDYQWGEWYQSLQVTYKFYTLRRTEYCNGAVVNEELNVSYATVFCYSSTGVACRYPASKALNVCVF